MDVPMMIRQRLAALQLDQRDLARAAQVTESYISQLLTRRRVPPAPNRTDIYEKMDRLLKLPRGELAKLAAHQRKEQLRRALGEEPAPLFGEVRALILRKCRPPRRRAVRTIVEKEPFGELERLVTSTILDLVKRLAREHLEDEHWLRTVARLAGRSYRDIRVVALDFLETDILRLSRDQCDAFLDPLIESWDVELETLAIEIELHPRVSQPATRRFGFVEIAPPPAREPGLDAFLADRALSGSATQAELDVLAGLRFGRARPTTLHYYRELQSLRDPLHFRWPA